MRHLMTILRFGWPFMRRYWTRFAAGIVLAWIFAASNTLILGAGKILLERLKSPTTTQTSQAGPADSTSSVASTDTSSPPKTPSSLDRLKAHASEIINRAVDSWLPL